MARTVLTLTADLLRQLPAENRECAFWEIDPVERSRGLAPDQLAEAKRDWVSATLLEWGACGQVVLVGDQPIGFVLYAPRAYVPSADSFATAPVSDDCVLLMTGSVLADYRGQGFGRVLVQAMVKDLVRRGVRGVEAFAAPRDHTQHGEDGHSATPCLLSSRFLSHVGFRTVRPHPVTPRMRLDVRATVTWRTDVEQAVDRLLGSIRPSSTAVPSAMSADR